MPSFSYRCSVCGKDFQKVVVYEGRHQVVCPECGKPATLQVGKIVAEGEVEVYDIVMPDTNKKCRRGINDILKDRWWDHKLKHDVAEHVEVHGLNNAESIGLVKDNRIKNKLDD